MNKYTSQTQIGQSNKQLATVADATSEPFLTVTITGHGPASGKTTLQLFLAEYLASRGCSVILSDDSVSESVFKNDMRRYAMVGGETKLEPVKVFVHVSSDISKDIPEGGLLYRGISKQMDESAKAD